MRNLEKKSPSAIGQFKQSDNTIAQSNNGFNNNSNDILTLDDNCRTKNVQQKPTPIKYQFNNIPAIFKAMNNLLLWKYELKDNRWTKVPYQINNDRADSTNPATWCSYDQAVEAYNTGNFDGIGFAIGDSGLTCIDIDHENVWPKDSLKQLLDGLNGKYYKESSPSGNGHHLWLMAVKPKDMGCKSKGFHNSLVEVYNANRFITMTGAVVAPYFDVQDAQQELETVFAPLIKTSKGKLKKPRPQVCFGNDDQSVIDIISKSKQASSFITLHENGQQGDHSSVDLTYMNTLAFYTGGNEAQMDRIFRGSALMRGKWDEMRGAQTYGQMTIDKSLEGRTDFYNDSSTYVTTGIKSSKSENKQFSLKAFSLNGKSTEMEKQMLEDKYVMNGIAILGQATAIYAKPNAGKTLTALKLITDAISEGDIDPGDIYYINADDNYKGLVTKLKLAEKHGFHMLCPGHNGFEPKEFQEYLASLTASDTARGVVIILDTLKKFNDIMDKKSSSDFGVVMRAFVSKGGTIIMLAHTNKNRDSDHKVVFSGTSDVVDDVDCAFTIDVTEVTETHKTIIFENIKSRGDVSREVIYKYLLKADSYEALVDSVAAVDEQEATKQKESKRVNDLLEVNKEGIDSITDALRDGNSKTEDIITFAHKQSAISKPKLRKVLKHHTGKMFQKGDRWQKTKGEKRTVHFELLEFLAGG